MDGGYILEKDAFGNEIIKDEVDAILEESSDIEEVLNSLNEIYNYVVDTEQRLFDTIIMLNTLPNMSNFSIKQTRLFNLFSAGTTIDLLDFFDIDPIEAQENGFEEYIYILLGESAREHLTNQWNDVVVKEVLTLIDINQEFFRIGKKKDYLLLLKKIESIPKLEEFKKANESDKIDIFIALSERYIGFYEREYQIINNFDLEKRYWKTQGWKLFKQVSRTIFEQGRNEAEDLKGLWKERNRYRKKLSLRQLSYNDYLMDDLSKYEREIIKASLKPTISTKTKNYIINFYKISLWAMLKSKGYESAHLAKMIIDEQLTFENESEKYIKEGIEVLKIALENKEKFPSPKRICTLIGLTEAKAQKYNLKLLLLDSAPINRINKWKRTNGQKSRKDYKNSIHPLKNPDKLAIVNEVGLLTDEGKTIPEIANLVNISERTVFTYRKLFKNMEEKKKSKKEDSKSDKLC